jgi:hypothetical protein
MGINRKFFRETARMRLFAGSLKKDQINGMEQILDLWEATRAGQDDRWLAYMLATAYHETARTMQPVRETLRATDADAIKVLDNAWHRGQLPWVSKPYWNQDANGKTWLGRGLVQLTHHDNYKRMSSVLGIDLVTDPSVAMNMKVALQVMFVGMERGYFTGASLHQFFDGQKEDWKNARRIINGLDQALPIADYGRAFYSCISYTV